MIFDSNAEASGAASMLFKDSNTFSAKSLITAYWISKSKDIVPLIVLKLYNQSLVVEDISSQDQQKITLYGSTGLPNSWTRPKEEVARLQQYIQDTVHNSQDDEDDF